MSTRCKYSCGRLVEVDFLYTDNCFRINPKQCYHVILIENGVLSLEINGEHLNCSAPCVLALKEDLEVEFVSSHMLTAKGIRFGVSFLNPNITFDLINSGKYESGAENWGFFPLKPFYNPKKAIQRCFGLTLLEFINMKKLFSSFHNAIEKQIDFRWSCRARQHLEMILELVFRVYSDYSNTKIQIFDPKDKNVWVSMILKEIHSRYSETLTVRSLADQIGINKTTVEKGFREVTGSSINNYLVNYRLSCASKLLSTTELNVSEISIQCGYHNPTFFNRQFKTRMGFTPLEYRKKIVESRKYEFSKINSGADD